MFNYDFLNITVDENEPGKSICKNQKALSSPEKNQKKRNQENPNFLKLHYILHYWLFDPAPLFPLVQPKIWITLHTIDHG